MTCIIWHGHISSEDLCKLRDGCTELTLYPTFAVLVTADGPIIRHYTYEVHLMSKLHIYGPWNAIFTCGKSRHLWYPVHTQHQRSDIQVAQRRDVPVVSQMLKMKERALDTILVLVFYSKCWRLLTYSHYEIRYLEHLGEKDENGARKW